MDEPPQREREVALYALSAAARLGDEEILKTLLLPAAMALQWERTPGAAPKIDSVLSALESRLGTTPVLALRAHMVGGANNTASGRCNAHELAEEIGSGSVPETRIFREFESLAVRCRLPLCLKEYKPCEHIQVIRRGTTSSALHRYVSPARQVLLLQPNKGSLKPMASALRSWGSFCDALGAAHFPTTGEVMSRLAIIYRE